MSDGKTHAIGTGAGIAAATVASYWLMKNGYPDAYGLICGAVGGHFVTPDLDQGQLRTYDEARMYKINPVLGWLWQMYWLPYGKILPHRSKWSHAPILGTVVRLVYLFGPLLAGLKIYSKEIVYQPWMAYALMGWMAQDMIHLALDGFRYHD